MGLHLLNISIDAADPNPQHIPEDLSINDQESILEVVFEQLLEFENLFIEFDDNDNEDLNNIKIVKPDFSLFKATSNYLFKFSFAQQHVFPEYLFFLAQRVIPIDSPPPEN
ncbi:hypothetical protein KFE94_13080 [bacterium SCSIO 12643]|nr:hypothetical protein KFE94_13080 [bacterium SCSIO 12643]